MRMQYLGFALFLAVSLPARQEQPPAQPQLEQLRQQMQQMQQERQRIEQQAQQERQQIEEARRQLEQRRQQEPSRSSWERALGGPAGRWWHRPEAAQKLALSADQRKKMDDLYEQSRLKLIDLNAAAQKEQVLMERLVTADQPDANRIAAQIDKVTQAQAEVEKENVRMLLGLRGVLSQEQWNKLQAGGGQPQAAAVAR